MREAQNLYARFLLPAAVIFVALVLRYLSANVPILDARFFYWPEEAIQYFLHLTVNQTGQVQAVSLVDLFLFLPLYWLQMRVLSGGERMIHRALRSTAHATAIFDAAETILILSLLGNRAPAPLAAAVALSVSTALKWLMGAGWLLLFVARSLWRR
ncbi:MAG: hypothetical protein HUU37_04980 [Bdellovibrionales bacterium]|nr:hypothetical protein [Bdellovibrionales bacterium]